MIGGGVVLAILAGAAVIPSWLARRPLNLVVISIDTLRADHVGAYGYGRPTTPHLDALALGAHRFEQAYAAMPTTLPSHASMFASLYPRQLGVRRNGQSLRPETVTLAKVLSDRGYATAAFVSSVALAARYGLNRGFAVYGDTDEPTRPGSATVAAARGWLRSMRAERPFFLFVHLYDPHSPYHAPPELRRKFGAPDQPEPPAFEFVPDPSIFVPEVVDACIRAYDAAIAAADAAVGDLLAEIDSLGLGRSTIVALVSDHGESLDELIASHGYAFDHGEFLYPHQLHVPLILRVPGGGAGVHDTPVSLLDLTPTLLDLLGLENLPQAMGRSLRPLLDGRSLARIRLFAERRTFDHLPVPYMTGDAVAVLSWPYWLITADAGPPELFRIDTARAEKVELQGQQDASPLPNLIAQWTQAVKPLWGPGAPERDPKALERLRALGYVQ